MKEFASLLASVSRSFYLSMHFLPKCMRNAVSVAYLLARATDSVADTSSASEERRQDILTEMGEMIQSLGNARQTGEVRSLPEEMIAAQSHEGERMLLSRFGECLAAAECLPDDQLLALKRVLDTIISGQLWDLSYFNLRSEVESARETDWYTYQVAGCVGEFWTDISVGCMGEDFAVRNSTEMKELGVRFGKGLQLVNILRDREEDRERGRSYLPAQDDASSWLERCRSYLEDGVSYARALKSRRLRFATVLPARLGLLTLDLIEEDVTRGGKRKVSRSVVRRQMLKALVFSWKRPSSP